MIDVILISDARMGNGKQLTIDCIHSLNMAVNSLNASNNLLPNIIVIESDPKTVWNDYKNITNSPFKITTIHPKEAFNYNRYLNIGIAAGRSEYVALCNNDLFFEKYWAENIVYAMSLASKSLNEEVLSASPFCPFSQGPAMGFVKLPYLVGCKIREHISGWCIFVKRKIFDTIGKLNEEVDFWFSDNIYADQLEASGLKHILATRSIVSHIDGGSNTLKTVDYDCQDKLTIGQAKHYQRAKQKINPSKEVTKPSVQKEEPTRDEYNPKMQAGPAPLKHGGRFN